MAGIAFVVVSPWLQSNHPPVPLNPRYVFGVKKSLPSIPSDLSLSKNDHIASNLFSTGQFTHNDTVAPSNSLPCSGFVNFA